MSMILAMLLVAVAVLPLLENETRPVLRKRNIFNMPRMRQYFVNRPDLFGPYVTAGRSLSAMGCKRVGLKFGGDDWEYPLWVLLRDKDEPVRIDHVCIDPSEGAAIDRNLPPAPLDIVLAVNLDRPQLDVNGLPYVRAGAAGPLTAFIPRKPKP
jgi:hypothetical protein